MNPSSSALSRVTEWSIDNRVTVLLLTLILAVTGVYSVLKTPIDAIPDLSDVQVIVRTPYPGQAPQVVENQVTYPLSVAMLAVPKASVVRGYSFFGDSYVYIIFEDGTDLYWARTRVLEYLSQVESDLPPDARPALGPDATGVGWIYEYVLVDKTGQYDTQELRSIQDWFLRYELQTVPGVAEVAAVGGMVRQYQVVVDPNRLFAFGLTINSVRQAIQTNNQETGGSVIEMAEAEYMIRSNGYIASVEHLRQIPLATTKEGSPVFLSDVADVQIGPELRRGVADLNGEGEVVGGIVTMRSGANALQTVNAVKDRIQEISSSLPEGVELVPTYDRSKLINRSIANLRNTLLEEFVIVAIVCLVFLFHFRSALVVIMSIPVAILGAFLIMRVQGISANIMSLGGIAIAVGILVDGAIILVERVHKQLAEIQARDGLLNSEQRWDAIKAASSEIGSPIFFSLLIVTLSFLPVFTLEAQEGRLFSPLAFTKTYATAVAAIMAITLIPVLIGYLVRGRIVSERQHPINRLLIGLYTPVIALALRYPKSILVCVFSLLLLGIWPITKLGTEFMPPLAEGDLMYMPTTHPGISIDKARELLQQTDRLIKTVPEVDTVFGKVGRAETATDPAPLTMIETMIQLKPTDEWRPGITLDDIRDELNRRIDVPGLNNAWVMPIKTRIDMLATGIKTPVGLKISGPELRVIEELGRSIETVLEDVPGTASVFAERVTGGRYIDVDIDRQKLARYGLDIEQVQEIVQIAIGGKTVAYTVEGLARYPINVRYPKETRDSVEKLKLLPVLTNDGARIALTEIANIQIVDGPPVVKSENARPSGWLYIDIEDRDLGSYVSEARETVSKEIQLPLNYSLQWSGQYQYLVRAQERLLIIVPITLLLIVLLLYINFKSIPDVLLILMTLPFALAGGIPLLYFLDFDLSVAVGVGFIALAGVAIELGVVMLTYLNLAMQRHVALIKEQERTMTLEVIVEAVQEGTVLRIRPIVMTTLTIILGLLPVMLGSGTGSEVMQRIAAPMFGGMLTAMILALVVLPLCYLLYKRIEYRV